ncbi:hypothetical protein PF006_g32066, partial [Phytophthora fragariae]
MNSITELSRYQPPKLDVQKPNIKAKLASRFFRAGIEQPLIRVREATRQFAAYHEAGDDTAMAPTTRSVSSSGWRGGRLERTRIARRRVQLKHTLSKTAEKLKPQQKPFA